jgi:hypothetical protein
MSRHALLAQVHMAVKGLAMPDDAYRAMLHARYGVESSGKLAMGKLVDLVKHFEKLGWVPKRGAASPRRAAKWVEVRDSDPHAGQKRQILAIWKKLGYGMASLDTRVARGFGVESFAWLHDEKMISTLLTDLQARERAFDRKAAANNG